MKAVGKLSAYWDRFQTISSTTTPEDPRGAWKSYVVSEKVPLTRDETCWISAYYDLDKKFTKIVVRECKTEKRKRRLVPTALLGAIDSEDNAVMRECKAGTKKRTLVTAEERILSSAVESEEKECLKLIGLIVRE